MDESELQYDILAAAYKYHALASYETPEVQLLDKYPVDVTLRKVEQLIKDGLLEMGAIERSAWPTEKGLKYLEDYKK